MAFKDTVKELLDQGLQVSREMASRAGEKAQELGSRGLEASREFAIKAGAKVQELGEKGVLALEIKQLEGQVKKLFGRLGVEVYTSFEKRSPGEGGSLSPDEPEIKAILEAIAALRESIEKREAELAKKR
ncbi:MAG: hypothetical protein LBJ31_03185 [Treponema sp.]|jgi:hypothetical protein|nr:hypothetical protein [Treponema sp.]